MKQNIQSAMQYSADAIVAGKHGAPLISDERLLHLHAALLQATGSKPAKAKAAAAPAIRFPAVYASLLADLTPQDRITADIPLHLEPFTATAPLELSPEIATGLAIGLAQNQPGSLVIAFTRAGRLQQDNFRQTLRTAARHQVPILYVLLPAPSTFDWSARAIREDVPCIPVDTHDAVALYRVAQETILRARNHGGPSLIDCKQVTLARGDSNPVTRLEAHLRRKGLLPTALQSASRKSTSATSRLA
ncbi:MAG: hypothetical protein ACP5M4_08020 [Acidobacteriaceae bacterium]